MGSDAHNILLTIALSMFFVTTTIIIHVFATTIDTINSTHFLKDGDTIVSPGGVFELGFFTPNNSLNRYVGIWYKHVSIQTVVWVANRESPVSAMNSSSSFFRIIDLGVLAIVNDEKTIWSTNTTTPGSAQGPGAVVARLLDSGNLVMSIGENVVWQSFDHPTDTQLPGMKIGENFPTGTEISLLAWKSETSDPSPGAYKFVFEPTGYPQLVITDNHGDPLYRLGPWNGLRWSGTPQLEKNGAVINRDISVNQTGVFMSYSVINSSSLVRVVMTSSGHIVRYIWADGIENWRTLHSIPADTCDTYGYCGPYGTCDYSNYPLCGCLDKFLPRHPQEWAKSNFSGGCVRARPLESGSNCGEKSGFLKYSRLKWPDTKFSWFNLSMNLQECERACLKNCSCSAYSSLDLSNGGKGCLLWFGDLIDIKVLSENGQDVFIRMAPSELAYTSSSSKGKKSKTIKLSLSLLVVLLVVSLSTIFIFYKRKGKAMSLKLRLEQDHTLFETPIIIRATDNFSSKNKIGEGGYGPVYKGVLDDGKEIAVKRLSKTSTQGLEEFKNEVIFIAKLQHRNLVKLLGWCIQGEEKMLIYEYMPNKSLDSFIFDDTGRLLLDWSKRFNIINGIARGLLYLHQDSRLRIIHRDLKASNILLDTDMNPKISDFGLAKCIAGDDEIGANTNRIAGTQGYMSPEYAGHGLFSTKSDVFSFGVLLLEIVSGKRNKGFLHQDHYENLLSYAWKLHNNGRSIDLVDVCVVESCNLAQVLRSIHIGLLCVQQNMEIRPSISSVVQMLTNDVDLPMVKEPGFFTGRVNETQIISQSTTTTTTTTNATTGSINEITISSFHPR